MPGRRTQLDRATLRMRVAELPSARRAIRAISDPIRLVERALQPALRRIRVASDRITAPMDCVVRPVRELQRSLRETEEGRELADLLAISDPRRTKDERLAVAQRVAARVSRPVHWTRWPRVCGSLAEEAARHGRTREGELEERTIAALFLVAHGMPGDTAVPGVDEFPLDPAETRAMLPGGLNKLVTRDLLGPGWRGSDAQYGTQYQFRLPEFMEPDARLENEIELLALLEQAALSDLENAVVFAVAHGESRARIARRLEISGSTVRVALHRAKRKISKTM